MTVAVRHQFESAIPDASVAGIVKPSHWNAAHNILADGPSVLGVPAAGIAQAVQEIIPASAGDILSYDGTTVAFRSATLALAPLSLTWSPGPVLTLTENSDSANVEVLRLQGDRAAFAANDLAFISFYLSDNLGAQREYARISWRADDVTNTSIDGRLFFSVVTNNALTQELQLLGTSFSPVANDGLALGTAALGYSDLFFATGAVIGFANGNLTVTHSTGVLALTSAISATVAPWRITNTNDAADVEVFRSDGDRVTMAANDQARWGMYLSSSTGVQTEVNRIAWQATNVTNGAMVSQMVFYTINTTLAARMVLTSTALAPNSNDLISLGTATVSWSDGFFASGAVLGFNNGNAAITHATDQLTVSASANTNATFRILNTSDSGSIEIFRREGDRATPSATDSLIEKWVISSSTSVQTEIARFTVMAVSVVNGAMTTRLQWGLQVTGSLNNVLELDGTTATPTFRPSGSGGVDFGDSTHMWGNVFINAAAKIDFNAGDVTITHATNQLTFAGATTNGYRFQDGPIRPVSNDGVALGIAGVAFSDLFLALGGIIDFNNGNVTLTHATGQLTSAGAQWVINRTTGPVMQLVNTEDVASSQILILRGARATSAANDNIFLTFQLQDSVGTATEYARIEARATSITNTTENGELRFHTAAPTLTEVFRLDSSQRFIQGGTASIAINATPDHPPFQVHSTVLQQSIAGYRWQNDTQGSQINLVKSKSNTIGTHTIGAVNDAAGSIVFRHSDGTNFIQVAAITAAIDGTPGTNDMPGRISFSTTADGASTVTERVRVDNQGFIRTIGGCFGRENVVTKTADFTLAATENWVINNKAAATCTVTLPAASSFPGREWMVQNNQAQTLVSASSNVVPKGGGAAGTAILPATATAWAILVSNGTNWVIMLSGT